jgi:Holliday junction resolvase RusA-like endonuclease
MGALVQVEWFWTRTKPDGDNALASLKPAFDGFTSACLLADDKELTHQPIRFEKDAKRPRVVIHISPIISEKPTTQNPNEISK